MLLSLIKISALFNFCSNSLCDTTLQSINLYLYFWKQNAYMDNILKVGNKRALFGWHFHLFQTLIQRFLKSIFWYILVKIGVSLFNLLKKSRFNFPLCWPSWPAYTSRQRVWLIYNHMDQKTEDPLIADFFTLHEISAFVNNTAHYKMFASSCTFRKVGAEFGQEWNCKYSNLMQACFWERSYTWPKLKVEMLIHFCDKDQAPQLLFILLIIEATVVNHDVMVQTMPPKTANLL